MLRRKVVTLSIKRLWDLLLCKVSIDCRLSDIQHAAYLRRKAFKLGKFLADANKLRKLRVHDELFLLELLGNGGNLVYLFMEQMTWCAGLPDSDYQVCNLPGSV